MSTKRKAYSAEFKAKLVLEVLEGEKMYKYDDLLCEELFRRILLNLEALNMVINGTIPDYLLPPSV